jgi:hypothetical protein
MQSNLEKKIRERAYFVAGSNSWFREKGDPIVESAIADATRFLNSVNKEVESPQITSGGTTYEILTAYWPIIVSGELKTISVSFFGRGRCEVNWLANDGTELQTDMDTIEKLLELDLPRKIKQLQTPHRGGSAGPRLH